jgi:hypothetical protein
MWQSLKATAEVVRERRKIKAEQAAAKIVAAAAVAAAAPVAATPVAAVPVNRPTKRNRGKTHRVKPESLAKSGTGQKVVAQ